MSAPAELNDGGSLDGEVIPPNQVQEWRTPSAEEADALVAEIIAKHSELVAGLRTTVEKGADLGDALIRFKARYRGSWLFELESKTPIRRRMAAMYMELARARYERDRRQWKRISNLGVAGAIADLRKHRRWAATVSNSNPPVSEPSASVAPLEPNELVAGILGHLFAYRHVHPDTAEAQILAALLDVERLVRGGALDVTTGLAT